MRTDIVHIGAGELTYEIRNIVAVGEKLEELGMKTYWENIGDPVAKGEHMPQWMKDIVSETVQNDATYGYSPTRGVLETRKFIAAETNKRGKVQLGPDDIIFFNGLGDAISKVFGFLKRTARVVVPTPSYTTHSSAEAAHAGDRPVPDEELDVDGLAPALGIAFPPASQAACSHGGCRRAPTGLLGGRVVPLGFRNDPVRTSWRQLDADAE